MTYNHSLWSFGKQDRNAGEAVSSSETISAEARRELAQIWHSADEDVLKYLEPDTGN